jgi:hypothetical protein
MFEMCAEHEKWIVEIEPGIWAHEQDLLVCAPAESVPVPYLDEQAV